MAPARGLRVELQRSIGLRADSVCAFNGANEPYYAISHRVGPRAGGFWHSVDLLDCQRRGGLLFFALKGKSFCCGLALVKLRKSDFCAVKGIERPLRRLFNGVHIVDVEHVWVVAC